MEDEVGPIAFQTQSKQSNSGWINLVKNEKIKLKLSDSKAEQVKYEVKKRKLTPDMLRKLQDTSRIPTKVVINEQ